MSERPEDRYEVTARIDVRRSARGRLMAGLVAVAIVGLIGSNVLDRLQASPAVPPAIAAPSQAVLAGVPPAPGPAFLPDVQVLQPAAALGSVPVALSGLAWLDLRTGDLTPGVGLEVQQWRFALADGRVLCACLDPLTGTASPGLHLVRFGPNGTADWATTLWGWLPASQRILLADAALVPGSSRVAIASVVQAGAGWDLRLQVVAIDGATTSLEVRLAGFDLAGFGDPAKVQLRLSVSPDGGRARVTLRTIAEDLSVVPGSSRSWDVEIGPSALGRLRAVPAVPIGLRRATCDGEAWASASTFVELCRSPDIGSDGRREVFVRLEPLGGAVSDVSLGTIDAGDVVGWQVDGSRGLVYAWSALGHRLDRLDVATGDVRLRAFGGGYADLRGLRSVAPDATPAPAVLPSTSGPRTDWQPIVTASLPQSDPLVGSSNGKLLFAAGYAFPTSPGSFSAIDSSGIWVFDARSLALVGHWPAAAAYDALGLTPTGRYLLAVGNPGGDELDLFGNHGRELVVIDTTDGSVVAVQRQLVLRLGGSPSFLPAGPPG